MAAGDTISGTVSAEPAGTTDEQRQVNANVLSGYVVELGGQRASAKPGAFKWVVPANDRSARVILRDERDKETADTAIPIQAATPPTGER